MLKRIIKSQLKVTRGGDKKSAFFHNEIMI